MLSHEQLKRYIYEQTKQSYFQAYLKEVQKNPKVKTRLAPSITITSGQKRLPARIELTSDMRNVKVYDNNQYSRHEYGIFPYAVVAKFQDNEFNPQDDLEDIDQDEINAIKSQSDEMTDPNVVASQEEHLENLAEEAKPKKKTTRRRRAAKTTAKATKTE